ncbi:MAG: hypothetical protein ACK4YQ_03655 [Phenylobacterium sp.]|uniref:hypothetical protein n=1 Tax=Phenylobacterium sp. TaxID=1871053 RepID=UPI00391BAE6B
MEQVLGYAADALWILALAIMASASRQAWGRLPAGAEIPVALGPDGSPALKTTRGPAVLAVPVAAFVAGAALLVARVWADQNPLAAVALFAVRAMAAALFALAHLRWLRLVLERAVQRP